MKKILYVFIVAMLCCIFIAYRNNNPKIIISNLIRGNSNFRTSELKYRVYLLGVFPIGEAVIGAEKVQNYRGQRVYHLTASARSLKVLSKIFSGQAFLDSYVNMEQFNPILFKQKLIISGRNDSDREIAYDQENGVMSIDDVKRQIFANTQDPLSAIFNIRRMDFNKVKEFKMNINTNQKNYILKGQATWQDISVDKGKYKIILAKAEIARSDKNKYHRSNITMTLVGGKDNVPILIKVFAGGILINVKLIDIK